MSRIVRFIRSPFLHVVGEEDGGPRAAHRRIDIGTCERSLYRDLPKAMPTPEELFLQAAQPLQAAVRVAKSSASANGSSSPTGSSRW